MKDGYRYFIARPTAEDGMPELGSDPMHFRVEYRLTYGTFFNRHVCFWNGSEWQSSMRQPFFAHLEDVLHSGATVRELLDRREIPHA